MTITIKRTTIALLLLMVVAEVANAQSELIQASPKVFGEEVISTGDYESHPAFTLSGDTLYFLKSGPDLSRWTICVSYLQKGKWTKPQIAPFSGQYMDADPFISPDGKFFYFISNRPLEGGQSAKDDMDIWRMEKTKKGWSEPVRLPDPINSDKSEYYPTLTRSGTLYFGSRREGGKGNADLYRAEWKEGKFMQPENLGDAINTEGSEFEPFISLNEDYLIFMAARPDHLDYADLYISIRKNGQWSAAEKLPPPINSSATEFSPKMSADGKYFFFASARNQYDTVHPRKETTADLEKRLRSWGNGLGDIYRMDARALLRWIKK